MLDLLEHAGWRPGEEEQRQDRSFSGGTNKSSKLWTEREKEEKEMGIWKTWRMTMTMLLLLMMMIMMMKGNFHHFHSMLEAARLKLEADGESSTSEAWVGCHGFLPRFTQTNGMGLQANYRSYMCVQSVITRYPTHQVWPWPVAYDSKQVGEIQMGVIRMTLVRQSYPSLKLRSSWNFHLWFRSHGMVDVRNKKVMGLSSILNFHDKSCCCLSIAPFFIPYMLSLKVPDVFAISHRFWIFISSWQTVKLWYTESNPNIKLYQ